jgi:transcriptional regulator with XRE-family HTH domain
VKTVTPERLLRSVGRRIAEIRATRGLTQEELAERLDVGVRYIQAVEAGRQNVTLKTMALFAAELRSQAISFFEPPNTKTPKPGRPKRRKPGA